MQLHHSIIQTRFFRLAQAGGLILSQRLRQLEGDLDGDFQQQLPAIREAILQHLPELKTASPARELMHLMSLLHRHLDAAAQTAEPAPYHPARAAAIGVLAASASQQPARRAILTGTVTHGILQPALQARRRHARAGLTGACAPEQRTQGRTHSRAITLLDLAQDALPLALMFLQILLREVQSHLEQNLHTTTMRVERAILPSRLEPEAEQSRQARTRLQAEAI